MKENTILETLRKIRALAERGTEGEKETALRMLDALIIKHGLSIEDIVEEQPCVFRYRNTHEEYLLGQVIGKVTNNPKIKAFIDKKRRIICMLTPIQRDEVERMFRFYRKALKSELKTFIQAFCVKHELGADPGNQENDERKPLDREECYRLLSMARGMRDLVPPRLQLEGDRAGV